MSKSAKQRSLCELHNLLQNILCVSTVLESAYVWLVDSCDMVAIRMSSLSCVNLDLFFFFLLRLTWVFGLLMMIILFVAKPCEMPCYVLVFIEAEIEKLTWNVHEHTAVWLVRKNSPCALALLLDAQVLQKMCYSKWRMLWRTFSSF